MSRNRNNELSYNCASSGTGRAAAGAVTTNEQTAYSTFAEARRRSLESVERAERERLAYFEEEAKRNYDYKTDE